MNKDLGRHQDTLKKSETYSAKVKADIKRRKAEGRKRIYKIEGQPENPERTLKVNK